MDKQTGMLTLGLDSVQKVDRKHLATVSGVHLVAFKVNAI